MSRFGNGNGEISCLSRALIEGVESVTGNA